MYSERKKITFSVDETLDAAIRNECKKQRISRSKYMSRLVIEDMTKRAEAIGTDIQSYLKNAKKEFLKE
jgi:hypothetical protein